MNILLTGADGFVGRNLTAALTQVGHRIVPASRRTGCDFLHMTDAAYWQPHLRDIDAVINSVGIVGETGRQRFAPLHRDAPTALFQACATAGIRRVIQISALGADHTAFSTYHLSKRTADDALRALDLDWFVLRPSLIYGRGGTSSSLFLHLAALPVVPLIGDGKQMLQPIHIADVAATVLRCLASPDTRQTLDIVGFGTVSFADWLARMRAAQGLPPTRALKIPPRLAFATFR
ncbi:MAG TPA: NAD-dependent epimerase/dehydratase family protein, partial [Azonexus sp.]|nr:NAD-dependent epimerase/dehydratase family protein [Azonexus sp.]